MSVGENATRHLVTFTDILRKGQDSGYFLIRTKLQLFCPLSTHHFAHFCAAFKLLEIMTMRHIFAHAPTFSENPKWNYIVM